MAARKWTWWGLVGVVLVAVNVWCLTRSHTDFRVYRGETMGSTFSVPWTESAPHPELPGEVNALLVRLTDLMSTHDLKSQLSEFNRSASTDWVSVAPEIAEVFDVTAKPLLTSVSGCSR